jgi:rhodanese-related sulfurtransferase
VAANAKTSSRARPSADKAENPESDRIEPRIRAGHASVVSRSRRSVWKWFAAYASLAWIYFTPVHAQTLDEVKEIVRKRFPDVPQLSTRELAEWLGNPAQTAPLLVDVRTRDEFSVSHLTNAFNSTSVEEVRRAARERPVVVYCSVGYRSSAFADKLIRQGMTNVFNLEGSIFQWANEGRPVYQGTNVVQKVHPYDSKWGKMLK